jgi:putative FmdB family regulatory protein
MPTYEYQCTRCGAVFELFQSITDKPKRMVDASLKNCDCDAPVKRLIGAGGGVLFKGSGFYETDYRSEDYKSAAKAEKEQAKGTTPDKSKKKSEPSKASPSGDAAKTKPGSGASKDT